MTPDTPAYRKLLDYLSDRNHSAFAAIVDDYRDAGLSVPPRLGDKRTAVPTQTGNPLAARLRGLEASLHEAAQDFDRLLDGITNRTRRRRGVKLAASAVGAVSTSALVGMVGTGSGGTGATLTAVLALASSLLTIFADFIGVRTDDFWKGLASASAGRETITQLEVRLGLLKGNPAGQTADIVAALEDAATQAITDTRNLMRKLHIEDLRQADS